MAHYLLQSLPNETFPEASYFNLVANRGKLIVSMT
jgi:hypothetical protein